MKAPWFPFYTGDFLASSDVQLMEAHEVGAYVLLLTHSWQSDRPGCLTADEGKLRRLARLSVEQWKDSSELLLSKWPVADNGIERFNPRLLKEAGKQVELREKKAEAGRLSAERRAQQATERQQSVNTIPTGVANNPTGVAILGNYSQPQPQPQATTVATSSLRSEVAAAAAPPKKAKGGKDYASTDVATYHLPAWTTQQFAVELGEWLTYRQAHRSGKLLRTSVEKMLNELRGYNEAFCSQLFQHAIKNGNQGLTFDNTAERFAAFQLGRPGQRPATPDPETDRLRAFTEEQAALPAPMMVYRSAPNRPAHLQPAALPHA